MKTLFATSLLIIAAALSFVATAQDTPAEQHKKLSAQEAILKNRVDSLQNVLIQKRVAYDTDTQNDELGGEIIALEGTLYDTRSRLSQIGTTISALEAQLEKTAYAAADAPKAGDGVAISNRNIIHNPFFKTNVSQKDLKILATSPKVIDQISQKSQEIDKIYANLLSLKSSFDSVQTQEELDMMITEAANIKMQITDIDTQLKAQWETLYNKKLDNYMVLSDKLGGLDRTTLENLDALSREVLHTQTIGEQSLSATLAAFHAQQSLILEYEMLFAQKLKISEAIDSLKTQKIKLAAMTNNSYQDIQFPYRHLVIYAPITIDNQYPYSDVKDVPAIKLPKRGAYYAVQVALVNPYASSLAIFKGAKPLQVEVTSNGARRYVIGGYKTYNDGAAAVKQCYGFGFKNPVLVAWLDGAPTTTAKAKAYQAANPNENSGADFKITILADGTQIAGVIKSTLDINSPGKTISRVEQDGKFLYTISRFTTSEEAQVIAYIIKTKEPNIENIEVQPITD